jgi:hypothetical protein
MTQETEVSGPIKNGIWDTRTRENSRWCSKCLKWLSLSAFYWIPSLDDRLQYHKDAYCVGSQS